MACLPPTVEIGSPGDAYPSTREVPMAGRGPTTFQKRQKEQQRKEKRLNKLARREERRLNPPSDDPDNDDLDIDDLDRDDDETTDSEDAEVDSPSRSNSPA
jgi:hypothetical protein